MSSGVSAASGGARRLPERVHTRDGASFEPRSDFWTYRDGVHNVYLDFTLLVGLARDLEAALKTTLVWYAENRAASHMCNLFKRMEHFVGFLRSTRGGFITSISSVELLSYRSSLNAGHQWYLGTLAGLLKKWHALALPGVTDDAISCLKELRLPGNQKGRAVLTMDSHYGPYTDIELSGIQAALDDAYERRQVDLGKYLLAKLFILLGQRPAQYAALKVCDVSVQRTTEGELVCLLRVPRAKQRNAPLRSRFTDRVIIPEIGRLLVEYAVQVKMRFADQLTDPSQAPLFPTHRRLHRWSRGFEYHGVAEDLGRWLKETLSTLAVTSERTGQPVHITAVRFRRTLATRAAEEGHGELVIAELLDHCDTQNVGIYVEATPAIVKRIDRAIALQMAPLAQAFAGVLINDESQATRGGDPSSRIVDPRIDPSMQPMGSCGQYSFCGLLAPIACYTCRYFQPWLDGPHDAVLAHLLEKRERLLETTDPRIAAIDERTILAVAEVVRRCEAVRVSQAATQERLCYGSKDC